MNNEVATVPQGNNGVVQMDLTPQQAAWVKLANVKKKLDDSLQKQELSIQSLLKDGTAIEVETNLAAAKKALGSLKGERMAFTNVVDEKIVSALMQYEKRSAGLIEEYEKKLLELKIKEQEAGKGAKDKAEETIKYAAYIKNEYERQVAEFKKQAWNEIYANYKLSLEDPRTKQEMFNAVLKTLSDMKFVPIVKYERKFVTDKEATDIYKKTPAPSVNALRDEMIGELNKVWANYDNDAAAKLSSHVEAEAQSKIEDVQNSLEQTTAITNMLAETEAASQATIIGATAGKKKVKTVLQVVEEDSLAWAIKIMIAFTQTPQCHMYLKAKIAGNIKVSQLADALGQYAEVTGKKVAGIQYEEKKKL